MGSMKPNISSKNHIISDSEEHSNEVYNIAPIKISDQVGYPQEALPTRAGGTGPPRTGFLNDGPPKGQYFFGLFLKMMSAL